MLNTKGRSEFIFLRLWKNSSESSPCKWNIKELFDWFRRQNIEMGAFPSIGGGD